MAQVTDEHNFEVVEWTIVNFSCWRKHFHGPAIKSPDFRSVLGISLKLELRPEGVGKYLLASIICNDPVALLGVFSIIGPDGSILSSGEPKGALYNFSLHGPKFDTVTAQIGEKDEDRLTLELKMIWKHNMVMMLRTEIATVSSSWKISSPTMKSLTPGFNWISKTFYQLDDDTMGNFELLALRFCTEIRLLLFHESSLLENVLVFVDVDVLGRDGSVLATAKKEHLFLERESWMFWNSALTKEIEDNFSLISRVKIVPSVKYKYSKGILYADVCFKTLSS